MADAVRSVVALGVDERDPAHEMGQVAILTRPENQMPVVAHDAIAAKTHVEPLKAFGQNLLEG